MRNPFSLDDSLLNQVTDAFSIERNGTIIGSAKGFFCGNDYPSTIQLVENIDVQDGDWLIHSVTNRRYFADKTEPITMGGEVIDWMVKYLSESEYNTTQSQALPTSINIGTINGPSIVGNQQNATLNVGNSIKDIRNLLSSLPATDQKSTEELIAELEKVENSSHPILVEGSLSKFSDLLKKHSDLLTAVGGWAIQLLIGK